MRQAFQIELALPKLNSAAATPMTVQERRGATARALKELRDQIQVLREQDPEIVLHERHNATMPIFVVETKKTLRSALRHLPGVRSVTPAALIHRIA